MKDGQFPEGYKSKLDFFETEECIHDVKKHFQKALAGRLSLRRVSAPRFLFTGTGLQDDLAGTQVPVSFSTVFSDRKVEIVHSLAKWKRFALARYGFSPGTGLYTDMDAIRKDEIVSPIHSVYVDQWDWEKVIREEERSLDFLKSEVRKIHEALRDTEEFVHMKFPVLRTRLPEKITFIHTEELEKMYPDLSPSEREDMVTKKYGAVFIIGIGGRLRSGKPHDLRAADYDDWSTSTSPGFQGLNGDIIVWDDIRSKALELSSMGIRVDPVSMKRQLEMLGLSERESLDFHKGVIDGSIPLSIGGGIGQSRICMFLLQKAHIGEVQSSVWPEDVEKIFEKQGVVLL
ncbi:MAG: aspartate--ammonia ligase [Candidatus Aenigmarchaeota archaeon]|nr:aspartate--ammonia ligase [Candidatus Aenigmarchaeota archaeon]